MSDLQPLDPTDAFGQLCRLKLGSGPSCCPAGVDGGSRGCVTWRRERDVGSESPSPVTASKAATRSRSSSPSTRAPLWSRRSPRLRTTSSEILPKDARILLAYRRRLTPAAQIRENGNA